MTSQNQFDPLHSKESECMVLGCMISGNSALSLASKILDPVDFFYYEHKLIFQTLKALYKDGKPGDVHLTAEALRKADQLRLSGGVAYLAHLAQLAGTSGNAAEYIKIIKTKSISRQALVLLEEGKKEFLSDPVEPSAVLERYRQRLIDLGKKGAAGESTLIGDVLAGSRINPAPMIDRIRGRQQFFKRNGTPFMVGLPTGFPELDEQATILEDTNLIVIAARPSMGKTAFALNLANHICIDRKKPVAMFSLEMGADQIVERFLSLRTRISGERLKRGEISDEELRCLEREEECLKSSSLFIQDQSCSAIHQVVAKARRLKEEAEIELFIIDYLQLMSAGSGAESRQYEVAEISRKLKLLAAELKTPIVCISQLSRKVEERREHRPIMSDLRDSGQIEQDSDVVIFIQRREYYDPYDMPGQAELIIAKNRNGNSVPSILLQFDVTCGRFSCLSKELVSGKVKASRQFRAERVFHEVTHPLLR